LIIASDGIWEFISNEEAVNVVVPYWLENDPDGACKKLESIATEYWKKVRKPVMIY
jgi:serine/threonine protein phosphatase PrpC